MNNDWSFGGAPDAPAWPTLENGEKEQAVLLQQVFDSPAEADMRLSMLSAYGIPCFKYYDKEGGAGKVISGFSGYGADLYVPASRLEEARALLTAEPIFDEDNS